MVAYLEDKGFRSADIDGDQIWYRPTDNILAFDAHRRNFVKTPAGVVPIDVNVMRPQGELKERLIRVIGGGEEPPQLRPG